MDTMNPVARALFISLLFLTIIGLPFAVAEAFGRNTGIYYLAMVMLMGGLMIIHQALVYIAPMALFAWYAGACISLIATWNTESFIWNVYFVMAGLLAIFLMWPRSEAYE